MLSVLNSLFVSWGLGEPIATLAARTLIVFSVLIVAFLADLIARRFIIRLVHKVVSRTQTTWDDRLKDYRVFEKLSHIAPALVLYGAAGIMFPHEEGFSFFIRHVCTAYMFVVGALVADALLSAGLAIYNTSAMSRERPIKAYVQVVKIVLYVITAILVIATLLSKSPWALLSGLGALTAVLLLVFRDSILGFVASIHLMSNNMVRPGDWIEMPKFGADGDVIDVSLTTVKVQNWDKTISTIPTYALISDSFKNWRGMSESGGRRIKRAVHIDVNSIRFCDSEMLERFSKFQLIEDYLAERSKEIEQYNQEHSIDTSTLVNGRRMTNVGVFRAYVEAYLRNHPKIHSDMTFLVRHLPPGDKGLPIEFYVFSNDQRWANYEAIQADIFDHIFAVIPEFGLRVFQSPSGADFQQFLKTG